VKLSASRRPWERLVWRATGQNLALYVGGSIGRRQLLDAWLQANGLPPGSQLEGGTLGLVQGPLGGMYLVVRTLPPGGRGWGYVLRARLRVAPPRRLRLTRCDGEWAKAEWPPPETS
jgi:hypothetical protein